MDKPVPTLPTEPTLSEQEQDAMLGRLMRRMLADNFQAFTHGDRITARWTTVDITPEESNLVAWLIAQALEKRRSA